MCVRARARPRSPGRGQPERAFLEWCSSRLRALGASIGHSRVAVGRVDALASGFELGLGTEGKDKEGFLSKGDPSPGGSPFPWLKR